MSLLKLKTHTHNPQETVKKRQREYMLPSSFPCTHPHPVPAVFLNPFCKGQKSCTTLIVSLPNVQLKNIPPPRKSNKEGLVYPETIKKQVSNKNLPNCKHNIYSCCFRCGSTERSGESGIQSAVSSVAWIRVMASEPLSGHPTCYLYSKPSKAPNRARKWDNLVEFLWFSRESSRDKLEKAHFMELCEKQEAGF